MRRTRAGGPAAIPDAMTTTRIRRFRDDDAAATAQVFFESVRRGTQGFYDEAQRRAWAPSPPALAGWRARLASQTVFVAERNGSVVGFMTLTADGCIDLAYVAPDVIGQGVAKALYDAILEEAARLGLTRLHAEASHLARAFFERQGWRVVKAQTVSRGGVPIPNFVMEKALA